MATWEKTVAAAAPVTLQPRPATKRRSSPTLTTEETTMARKGARLSPMPRRAAAYTLYTAMKGMPKKMTAR